MALQTFEVQYSFNGTTFTALPNYVVSVNINNGRRAQLDQYNCSTASFEVRWPSTTVNPSSVFYTGVFIRIVNTTSGLNQFQGKISNVTMSYGIPLKGTSSPADVVKVSCEGSFATLGRTQGSGYSMAANVLAAQLSTASTQSGVTQIYSLASSPSMAATTVNSTWGDWLNRSLVTTNSRMIDSQNNGVLVVSPYDYTASAVNFSDTTNNATNQVYDEINFESLADNYYTQVTVTPESFGAATVLKSGATKPYRTLQTNTFNASTSQATDFANYLLGNYGTQTFAIGSISCMSEAQSSFKLDAIGAGVSSGTSSIIGAQVSVAFRGTTYRAIVEGVAVSATPAGSRYTYYLSGADLNAYLILGNTTFGRLDFNKLGY